MDHIHLPQLLLGLPSSSYPILTFLYFLTYWVHFDLLNYSWEWGLYWEVFDLPNIISSESWFSLSQQLANINNSSANSIIFAYLMIAMLGYCWAWASTSFVYSVTIIVHLCVQLPYCMQKTLFPWSYSLPLSLPVFILHFSPKTLRLEGRVWCVYSIEDYAPHSILFSSCWSSKAVCINFCLLQQEKLR